MPKYPASDPSHNVQDFVNVIGYAVLSHARASAVARGHSRAAPHVGAALHRRAVRRMGAQLAQLTGEALIGGAAGSHGAAGHLEPRTCLPREPPPVVFVQLHGKAPTTCTNVTVFASAGFAGRAPTPPGRHGSVTAAAAAAGGGGTVGQDTCGCASAADELYGVAGQEWPQQRIAEALGREFPTWRVRNPGQDACPLVASRNVLARVVNGAEREEACSEGGAWQHACPNPAGRADSSGAPTRPGSWPRSCDRPCGQWGAFVHLEQAPEAVSQKAWHGWVRALCVALNPLMPHL
eukprot:251863-Chlamydomonas_euryale.AAC.2